MKWSKRRYEIDGLRALPLVALAFAAGLVFTVNLRAGADSAPKGSLLERELHPEWYKGPKTPTADTTWHEDILGDGFESRYVNEGIAFDGPVRCTIIRRKCSKPSGKAVLYVHGFNDYFFQRELGDRFNEHDINFYAVDLRRYGRSLQPWQYPFDVRNFNEYFVDIDSAMNQIRRDGNTDITLAGHSTGGLTTALYCSQRGARCGVRRLVTDSPFLEWNFSGLYRHFLIPALSLWGSISPNTKIDQGHCDAYSESLLKQYHGEWEYNTDWKMVYSPPVKASWIKAVNGAQGKLMKHAHNITVPVLVMHSSTGLNTCSWTPECQYADVVLDPAMLQARGKKLGKNPTVCTIDSGMHDLILSSKPVRDNAYDTIFDFIASH